MPPLRAMKSMELDDEEKLDAIMPIPAGKPDYPYGLRICLTEKEFKKLKIDPSDIEVGGIFHGHFLGRITSVSRHDGQAGEECRVEAQIEDLDLESEDDENEKE